jgi:AcrR family transcriptional regulator
MINSKTNRGLFVQYLKADVKQKIISSALTEFSKSGYRNASMRDIAANADIVSGNIYRYFKNKEDLFESAVGPTFELIQKVDQQFQEEITKGTDDFCSRFKNISLHIVDIFSQFGIELLILLDKSEGTKYASCKDEIKRTLIGSLHNVYLAELKKQGKELEDDFILDVIASSYIDGICLILRNNKYESMTKLVLSWFTIVFYDLHNRI